MVLPPGNIESVPVMPSSPEQLNADLSESIGKATISSSRKWQCEYNTKNVNIKIDLKQYRRINI
jgi:hypothetical protein